MTYCLGLLLRDGLILMADTRTNAGIDNISTYAKLHELADRPDRHIVALTAGNLSVSQAVLAQLAEGLPPGPGEERPRMVTEAPTMFRAAQLVGEVVTLTLERLRPGLQRAGVDWSVSLLLGGRIAGGPLALYLIYDAGNFIACEPASPFLQIGDTHYGKPILDRMIAHDMALDEAVKVGLLSFDATLRSNLSVGLPIDLLAIPADAALPPISRRIEANDAYFHDLSARWSRLLNEARAAIPDPPFMAPRDGG